MEHLALGSCRLFQQSLLKQKRHTHRITPEPEEGMVRENKKLTSN